MAAVLLGAKLAERGVDARVHSAGTLCWGGPATDHAVAVLAERGLDLAPHRSRQLTPELVADADLVLGMTRDHVGSAVARQPAALTRSFLLGEIVRLGRAAGARRSEQTLEDWIRSVAVLRPVERPPGRAGDEVADPAGESLEVYRRTAERLDKLTTSLARLLAT